MRSLSGASSAVVAMLALSVAASGCGKVGEIQARKAFKEANAAYQAQDYKKAAEAYEKAIQAAPETPQAHQSYFFLANSYDQMFKPSRKGEAANDALLTKAVENYQTAAEKLSTSADPQDKKLGKLALEYLVSAYGSEKLNDPAKAEPVYKQIIEMDPGEPANYAALSKLYEDAGRYDEAEAQLVKAQEVKPNDPVVYTNLANFYNKQGEFEKTIDALEKAANLNPNNPEGWHRVATFYWDKARKDYRLTTAQQKDYIMKGLAMEDKALGLNPEYMEAMTYKNILLRMQANTEKDPAKQKELLNQADELRNKVLDMQKRKQTGKG